MHCITAFVVRFFSQRFRFSEKIEWMKVVMGEHVLIADNDEADNNCLVNKQGVALCVVRLSVCLCTWVSSVPHATSLSPYNYRRR